MCVYVHMGTYVRAYVLMGKRSISGVFIYCLHLIFEKDSLLEPESHEFR